MYHVVIFRHNSLKYKALIHSFFSIEKSTSLSPKPNSPPLPNHSQQDNR